MNGYNKEIADKLAEDFEKITGMSLNDTSRKTNSVITRCLFYKVLEKFNYMNDRLIAEWFETRGIKKNRSSIFIAMSNVDIYYKTYPLFRDCYDMYFDDKLNKRLKDQKSKQKRLNEYKEIVKQIHLKEKKDPLSLCLLLSLSAIYFAMNHFFENNTYHLISSIIWGVQFFSHLLTACINPGIPSRKNFLTEYIKENKINNPNVEDYYQRLIDPEKGKLNKDEFTTLFTENKFDTLFVR